MSKVRNSDIRSELRPSAQLLKLTYTAATEAAFEKFDRQCIKKNRGKWKSRNTVAEEKAIVRSDGSILRILVVRCEDAEEENATGLLWLHDGGYAYGVPEQESAWLFSRIIPNPLKLRIPQPWRTATVCFCG